MGLTRRCKVIGEINVKYGGAVDWLEEHRSLSCFVLELRKGLAERWMVLPKVNAHLDSRRITSATYGVIYVPVRFVNDRPEH